MIPKLEIIDNFYADPWKVRELMLSLEYSRPARTNYPGERTGHLEVVAPEFYAEWKEKFMSLYGYLHDGEWRFSTQFQRIPTKLWDPEANDGWIHCDPSEHMAGVVYLNHKPDPKAGTAVMVPRPGTNPHTNAGLKFRNDFYGGRNCITEQEFIAAKNFNNNKYDLDVMAENQFNRCVVFNCQLPHKQTTFGQHEDDDYRYTHIFFARMLGK